ncbi:MAG: prepilin peptidase [Pseudomonadota bacterium]
MGEPLPIDLFPAWILICFAVAWGAIWGSFATVIVWRFPRDESIVRPGSHCTGCMEPVRWYDNIPLLSYLMLGGKCRRCRTKISLIYPGIELSSVLLALVAFHLGHESQVTLVALLTEFFIAFTFFWALFVVSLVDLDSFLIPDIVTLPGIVLFLTYNAITSRETLLFTAISVVGAYLLVWLAFNALYKVVSGREGMGMGDAKLLAMIAAMTGWKGALFSLIAGALQGLIINTPLLVMKKKKAAGPGGPRETGGAEERTLLKTEVPFGPLLALGAFEYFLWGREITGIYFCVADTIAAWVTR